MTISATAFLRRVNDHLPEWLNKSEMQWIPWAYAAWQVFRRNPVVLLTLSLLPFLVRKAINKNLRIVALIAASRKDFVRPKVETKGVEQFNKTPPATFKIVPQNIINLPRDWVALHFRGGIYLLQTKALDMMAKWISDCNYDEHNVVFVNWATASMVGEQLSREEAYHMIFSGEYYAVGSSEFGSLARFPGMFKIRLSIVPTYLRYVEGNTKWWGVLATLPALLQAFKQDRLAMLLTLFLIIVDSMRYYLNDAYERIYGCLRRWLKQRLPMKDHYIIYFILAQLFSVRWLWHAERRRSGDRVLLQHFSRLQTLTDVSIHGDERYSPFGDVLLRMWDGLGIGLEVEEGTQVVRATLQRDIFVEYFSTAHTLPLRLSSVWIPSCCRRMLPVFSKDDPKQMV